LETLEADPPLWTGVTIACDHSLGILQTDMNDEEMRDKGPTIQSAVFLKSNGGNPSGPLAPPTLSFFIAA